MHLSFAVCVHRLSQSIKSPPPIFGENGTSDEECSTSSRRVHTSLPVWSQPFFSSGFVERCVTTHRTAVNLSSTCEWLTHRIRIHSGINNDKCSIYNNRLPDDCMSTTINKLFATKLKVWCSVYLKVDTKRWWCGHKCIFMIMRVFKLLYKLVNVAKTYW